MVLFALDRLCKKIKFRKMAVAVLGVLAAAALLTAACPVSVEVSEETPNAEDPAELFSEVYEAVEELYVDPDAVDPDAIAEAAVRALLDELNDPYVSYIPPSRYDSTLDRLSGTYEGIGARVNQELDGDIVILDFLPGSKAPAAGLRIGDVITGVDGMSVVGLDSSEVIPMILGEEGTFVELQVRRDMEELDILIERQTISTSVVTTEIVTVDGVDFGVIHIPSFAIDTHGQFGTALCQVVGGEGCEGRERQDIGGIIVDLRNNPGGFLNSTIGSASWLLDADSELPVLYELDNNDDETLHEVEEVEVSFSSPALPVAVLINGGSASGSEVFSAALRDHGRAILVGEQTFGKGSVNRFVELSNGGGVYLTIARWYTPCGDLIEGQGIAAELEGDTVEAAARHLLNGERGMARCSTFTPPS